MDKFKLRQYFQFNCECLGAKWSNQRQEWDVIFLDRRTKQKFTRKCGVLSLPSVASRSLEMPGFPAWSRSKARSSTPLNGIILSQCQEADPVRAEPAMVPRTAEPGLHPLVKVLLQVYAIVATILPTQAIPRHRRAVSSIQSQQSSTAHRNRERGQTIHLQKSTQKVPFFYCTGFPPGLQETGSRPWLPCFSLER